jgi:hypothetical protein
MKQVLFFSTTEEFRAWLERNHANEAELFVGFYKKASGKPSITWPESVDAALCYGWIDGVRNAIDELSYRIRFTPRKPSSTWSAVNVKRVAQLSKLRLMRPAGIKAFEARKGDKRRNSREHPHPPLDACRKHRHTTRVRTSRTPSATPEIRDRLHARRARARRPAHLLDRIVDLHQRSLSLLRVGQQSLLGAGPNSEIHQSVSSNDEESCLGPDS